MTTDPETQLRALERIPTVGRKTAIALLRSGYDSPEMVANTDPTSLAGVYGIGEQSAPRLIRHAQTTAQLVSGPATDGEN